jgi:hypothetical protein
MADAGGVLTMAADRASILRSKIANRGERIVHISNPQLRQAIEANLSKYSPNEQAEWRLLIDLVERWDRELSR